MKKKAIVVDNVAHADSVTDDDGIRFMVKSINEHTSAMMSEEIDVPIIILDDDDDDDDLKIDKEYKLFLDHLTGDKNLGPLVESNPSLRYEADIGKCETRKFDTFSGDSKRSKLENEKKRVSQQIKRETVGFKAEISRTVPFSTTRENIQRDNRVAERRKRRIAYLEAAKRVVPVVRDNKVRKFSELNSDTLGDATLVRAEEYIQPERKAGELKAETFRKAVSLVRIVESKVVNKASKTVNESSRNKGVFAWRKKKNEEESVAIVDKDYMNYLTWLVDSLKDLTTKPIANLHKDQSDFNPPTSDALKESTMVLEKDVLLKVKVEQDVESWPDDSDIIEIGDSPFMDGEGTPFVASKKVVDLDEGSKEDESSNCLFKKELMDVLKKPYNERELKELHREASIHRRMTRRRELRKGRETEYETDELGQSYRECFPDFEKAYRPVDGVDKARALKLLRGFFFYLKNVSQDGAFKPWQKNKWWLP